MSVTSAPLDEAAALRRWLGQVSHDLVKRLLWPARDRRDLGGSPAPSELVVRLIDDEGAEIQAAALWRRLCAEGPAPLRAGRLQDALAHFEAALGRAEEAGRAGDVEGVLRLGDAFAELERQVMTGSATSGRER